MDVGGDGDVELTSAQTYQRLHRSGMKKPLHLGGAPTNGRPRKGQAGRSVPQTLAPHYPSMVRGTRTGRIVTEAACPDCVRSTSRSNVRRGEQHPWGGAASGRWRGRAGASRRLLRVVRRTHPRSDAKKRDRAEARSRVNSKSVGQRPDQLLDDPDEPDISVRRPFERTGRARDGGVAAVDAVGDLQLSAAGPADLDVAVG
jgi:hypothetical protein